MLMEGGRGGFRLGKVENVGIEGIAYCDGQFTAGIPEGLLTFHYKKDQISLFLLNTFYL